MARLRRAIIGAGTLAFVGIAASGCGNSGAISDAQSACRQVSKSIALYASITPSTPADQAAQIASMAQSELLAALPHAAAATSADGTYNALMTTIGEASRVPENLLIPALKAQCRVVMSTSPFLAQ